MSWVVGGAGDILPGGLVFWNRNFLRTEGYYWVITGAAMVGLECGSVELSRKHFTYQGMAGISVEADELTR